MISIPSLGDLATRVRNAFRTELPGSDAYLWPNNLNPTAKVIAGALFAVYLRLDYVARQIFAATAEGQWLDRHGAEYGMARLPAAAATGSVSFTSTGALTIAAGAILQRSDGSKVATLTGGSLVSAGTLTLQVAAAVAGSDGTTLAGTALTPVSGVTGSSTIVVAAGGLTGGADLESDDAFRARILFRKRNPPHGGAPADYVSWVTAIPGVTRVYIERQWIGPATIRVFPLTDGATAAGIPSATMVATVASVLGTVAPAGAAITVAAPAQTTINITVQGLTPNTTDVQQAVLSELRDAFRRLAKPSGVDIVHPAMPYLASPQVFSRSWIWQAIANATGEQRHSVVAPAFDVQVPAGSMAVLGTVTFIS